MTADRDSRADEPDPQESFEDSLRREGLEKPARREHIAGLLAAIREFDRLPVWPADIEPGESEIGLYWHVWRNQKRADGFEVLCGCSAPTSVVLQLKRNIRPARERDFMYLDTLPPRCAKCGWTNHEVMARREVAHAAERAWRARD